MGDRVAGAWRRRRRAGRQHATRGGLPPEWRTEAGPIGRAFSPRECEFVDTAPLHRVGVRRGCQTRLATPRGQETTILQPATVVGAMGARGDFRCTCTTRALVRGSILDGWPEVLAAGFVPEVPCSGLPTPSIRDEHGTGWTRAHHAWCRRCRVEVVAASRGLVRAPTRRVGRKAPVSGPSCRAEARSERADPPRWEAGS